VRWEQIKTEGTMISGGPDGVPVIVRSRRSCWIKSSGVRLRQETRRGGMEIRRKSAMRPLPEHPGAAAQQLPLCHHSPSRLASGCGWFRRCPSLLDNGGRNRRPGTERFLNIASRRRPASSPMRTSGGRAPARSHPGIVVVAGRAERDGGVSAKAPPAPPARL